jgi:hypothetical protein
MTRMQQHAERFETEVINDTIVDVDFSSRPFILNGADTIYTADAVLLYSIEILPVFDFSISWSDKIFSLENLSLLRTIVT